MRGKLALAVTQAVFRLFTYPVNALSAQWTRVPPSFEAARLQWELSHGVSALQSIGALVAIVLSVLFDASGPAATSDRISR